MEPRRTGAVDRLTKISQWPQDAAGHKEGDPGTSNNCTTDDPSEKQGITSSKLFVMCPVLGELQDKLLVIGLRERGNQREILMITCTINCYRGPLPRRRKGFREHLDRQKGTHLRAFCDHISRAI